VQEQQSPCTSRVALVPYSMGVNLGDYADSVRGPLKDTTPISAADWADASRSLSRVSSGVLTANSHGLKAGEYVWISGVSNASSGLNNRIHRVSSVTADTFQLDGFFGSGSRNTGSFRRCWSSDCRVWVTSAQHTLSTGDWVRISGVQGMSGLNAYFQATKISDDQFSVDLSGPGNPPILEGGPSSAATMAAGTDTTSAATTALCENFRRALASVNACGSREIVSANWCRRTELLSEQRRGTIGSAATIRTATTAV